MLRWVTALQDACHILFCGKHLMRSVVGTVPVLWHYCAAGGDGWAALSCL